MESKLIREKFIKFFIQKNHKYQPSVPIVNKKDPSLLFVNAGINPFKDIILGNYPITNSRIVTVQPCLRVSGKHNDLEEVGVDTYHHTFFEMLGNWSFGDYSKEDTIDWAWELLTEVFNFPKERIYVTIFSGDEQNLLPKDQDSVIIWKKYLPESHILSFSKKYNFWEMGDQGPCGPCSEIHLDIRSDYEFKYNPLLASELINKGHPHVIEIWNLVFMQYNRQASGKLVDLPYKHIDTGMGFERLAMVLQHKKSNYDTDIFIPLISKIENLSGKDYNKNKNISIAMRVIVDHIRAVTFAIADGQAPAHTKGGYVIRRILRRAIRYGYSHLDLKKPFIYKIVSVLVVQMENIYPKIKIQQGYITDIIEAEEVSFLKTLSTGLQLFNQIYTTASKVDQKVIEGRIAFELYNTYGFPLDLTLLIAKEQGLEIDKTGFEKALQEHKKLSKKKSTIDQGEWKIIKPEIQSIFIGYHNLIVTTCIVQWRSIKNNKNIAYQLVLEKTPFYAEGGGQVSDTGFILFGKESIPVIDVQKEHGLILHTVHKLPTDLEVCVEAHVDAKRRILISNNHTTTHLLQSALKKVMGNHVTQKGSFISPDILRFDFVHPIKLSTQQIEFVEYIVNQKIRENISCIEQLNVPLEKAKKMGAEALFDEKYCSEVRVIIFDSTYSLEICGGTHVSFTGQIGFFKIIHESAVGRGIRRIEALTSDSAYHFVNKQLDTFNKITDLLKHPKDPLQTLYHLFSEKKQLQKQLMAYQAKAIEKVIAQLKNHLEPVSNGYLLIQSVQQLPHTKALQQIAMYFYKSQYKEIAIVLATTFNKQVHLIIVVSDGWSKNNHAHNIMQLIAPIISGKGGGNYFFAIGQGSKATGIPAALKTARQSFIV